MTIAVDTELNPNTHSSYLQTVWAVYPTWRAVGELRPQHPDLTSPAPLSNSAHRLERAPSDRASLYSDYLQGLHCIGKIVKKNPQGIVLAQVVNSLILKIQDIATYREHFESQFLLWSCCKFLKLAWGIQYSKLYFFLRGPWTEALICLIVRMCVCVMTLQTTCLTLPHATQWEYVKEDIHLLLWSSA